MTSAAILLLLVTVSTWISSAPASWMEALLAVGVVAGGFFLVRQHAALALPWRRVIWLLPIFIYVTVQAANASHRFVPDEGALVPRPHVSWLPHSVDAPATWRALLALCAYAVTFWLAACGLPRRLHRGWLALLGMHGFLLAVSAMLTRPVLVVRSHTPMGPFVNENNFAAYMNLLIPVMLAFGRETQAATGARRSHPAFLIYFAATCMLAAVAVSESRTGLVIGVLQFIAWFLLEMGHAWARDRRIRRTPILALLLALVVLGLLGGAPIARQVRLLTEEKVAITVQMRTLAMQGTWRMVQDAPVIGVGAGCFAYAFPYYQPQRLLGFFRFAHNDWLQALAELGALGIVLLGFAAAAAMSPAWRGAGRLLGEPIGRGLVLALAGLMAHALVDFPMQIPSVMVLAAMLAGMAGRRVEAGPP